MDNQEVSSEPEPVPATAASDISIPDESAALDKLDSSIWKYFLRHWLIVAAILIATIVCLVQLHDLTIALLIIFIGLGILHSRYEQALLKSFAAANNFKYEKDGVPPTQDGMIFSLGHSPNFSGYVSGTYLQWPLRLFLYSYTIGYGKSSSNYTRAVVEVAFGTALPPFVLRRHHIIDIDSEGESLNSKGYTQKVALEGVSKDHFDVHIPPSTQDDVLSVLTPDVIEILEGLGKYEIEMASNGN